MKRKSWQDFTENTLLHVDSGSGLKFRLDSKLTSQPELHEQLENATQIHACP